MDLVALAQLVTAVTNLLFTTLLAGGYHFTWRASQQTRNEMKEQRPAMVEAAGHRAEEHYDDLPELDVAILERQRGAAREITSAFSAPLGNSSGFVISGLPYFKNGLDFLPPQRPRRRPLTKAAGASTRFSTRTPASCATRAWATS
jgi:hypothetical protein